MRVQKYELSICAEVLLITDQMALTCKLLKHFHNEADVAFHLRHPRREALKLLVNRANCVSRAAGRNTASETL